MTARGICGINRKNSSWERTLLQLQLWTRGSAALLGKSSQREVLWNSIVMDSGNVGPCLVKLLSQSTALFSTCTHSSPALSILKRQKNRKHSRHFITLSAPETPTTHPTPPLPCRVTFLTGHNCSVGSELEEGVTAILSRILGLSSCCCCAG